MTVTELWEVTSHGDLFLLCTRLAFSTVSLETTLGEFAFCFTRDEKALTFIQVFSVPHSILPASSISSPLIQGCSPRKGPSCVKTETGLIPVSSVHKRLQLCIQNLRKCVCQKERERESESKREREREMEQAQLCIQSSSKLTSGPAWCFSWKLFFQQQSHS